MFLCCDLPADPHPTGWVTSFIICWLCGLFKRQKKRKFFLFLSTYKRTWVRRERVFATVHVENEA